MYLWKRENGFTFQQRIPVNVESRFGKSPIRVSLGPLPAATARKRAIILSGAAQQLMDDPHMTRETLVHSLRALNEELNALKKKRAWANFSAQNLVKNAQDSEENGDTSYADHQRHQGILATSEAKVLNHLEGRLKGIGDALSRDAIAWESERETFQSVVRTLGSLGGQINVPQIQQVQQTPQPQTNTPPIGETQDERTVSASTKLRVAGRIVLDSRKEALDSNDKDKSRYEERLEATFAAFLEVIGDHPLSYYLPIHLQDFATAMAKVPTNRTKYPIFKGLTLKAMGEKNDKLPENERIKRLSATTVKEHVAQIKLIWEKATAGVVGIRDIRSFNVTMPVAATPAIDREGLPTSSLNKWLADSVRPETMRKPHKAWLPLVAYLTGMRLSEIVYLQSSDIVTVEGNEVLDLRRPLIIDGKKIDRPLKTKTSVRIVAIHPLLRECGFIDFAKNQRGRGGFIFPHYHTAKDPADAAQKQMSNWMVALGVHEPQRQVFHSLRHNAKSWLRIHAGDGLADKQCGHAASTVGAKYGFKSLEPEEVQKIMAIPAPRDIDFAPFINWHLSQQ